MSNIDAIYFDMDGTIADLYNVENWEPKLRSYDPTPYSEAKPLYDMGKLNSLIERFAAKGVRVGVISWLSKGSTREYDNKVAKAKRGWLSKYLPAIKEIHLVPYGTPKHEVAATENAVLVDDNEEVRQSWEGETADATQNILPQLLQLIGSLN